MDRFVIRMKPKEVVESSKANSGDRATDTGAGSGSTDRGGSIVMEGGGLGSSSIDTTIQNQVSERPTRISNTSALTAPIVSSESDSESQLSSGDEGPSVAKRKRKKYTQHFKNEWLQEFLWLTCKDNTSFCKICNKSIQGSYTHLSRHEKRSVHKRKLEMRKGMANLNDIYENINQAGVVKRQTKEAEFKLCMFVVEHNMPFLIMEHLPDLLKSALPDSKIAKNIKCSRTKATATVKSMGKEYHKQISAILNAFSIIVDEVTDISVTKCLAILARYVQRKIENFGPRDRLLTFVAVQNLTADGITDAILTALKDLNIKTDNMIGFAADNASVMMGDRAGVQAKLKETNPDIFTLGCVCHSMALCASKAAEALPSWVEEFIRDIYNYIGKSSKRMSEFKEIQQFLNLKPHKILRACQTRWLSLEEAIKRVLELWTPLTMYFTAASFDDKLKRTDDLLKGLKNPPVKLYFIFLKYVLANINKINLEFQAKATQLPFLFERISSLYKTILKNFMIPEYIDSTPFLSINPNWPSKFLPQSQVYFGEEAEQFIITSNIKKEDLTSFHQHTLKYYIELCSQIRKRFANLPEYENFNLLHPKAVLLENKKLTPLLMQFKHLVEGDLETVSTEYRQIGNLNSSTKEKLLKLDFQSFWFEIYSIKNVDNQSMFHNICNFIFNIISLPHSSAAAERIFSRVNLIKTKSRNRLLPETCNDLLMSYELLRENNNTCFDWAPNETLCNETVEYQRK